MSEIGWSQQQIDLMLDLHKQGLSNAKIGAHVGKTKSAVQRKLHRMGFSDPLRSARMKEVVKRDKILAEERKTLVKKPSQPDAPEWAKPLVDLGPHDCLYPFGDKPFLFCGKPKKLGSSYCDVHHMICYQRVVK